MENSNDENDIGNWEIQNTFKDQCNLDNYKFFDTNDLPVEINFDGDIIEIPLTYNNDIFKPNFSVTSNNTQDIEKNNNPLHCQTSSTNRKTLR